MTKQEACQYDRGQKCRARNRLAGMLEFGAQQLARAWLDFGRSTQPLLPACIPKRCTAKSALTMVGVAPLAAQLLRARPLRDRQPPADSARIGAI
jgi:hypothetical protein